MTANRSRWFLAILIGLSGCATVPQSENKPAAQATIGAAASQGPSDPASSAQDIGISGVWQGMSYADCIGIGIDNPGRCAAMQNITLTMFQHGHKVTGFYKCAYGNQVCRNLDEQGVIRNGEMNGIRLTMRVMLEDGSMCFFTGIPKGDLLNGRYSCLQGGGIVEQGRFRTQRSY
jgi:hypothetical protein